MISLNDRAQAGPALASGPSAGRGGCCPQVLSPPHTQNPEAGVLPRFVLFLVESSDVERLERFFDSEDEDFEILSL